MYIYKYTCIVMVNGLKMYFIVYYHIYYILYMNKLQPKLGPLNYVFMSFFLLNQITNVLSKI